MLHSAKKVKTTLVQVIKPPPHEVQTGLCATALSFCLSVRLFVRLSREMCMQNAVFSKTKQKELYGLYRRPTGSGFFKEPILGPLG